MVYVTYRNEEVVYHITTPEEQNRIDYDLARFNKYKSERDRIKKEIPNGQLQLDALNANRVQYNQDIYASRDGYKK